MHIKDWYSLGFFTELSKYHQLILIDGRGFGESSKPHDPKDYSLKSKADDTIAVLNAEGIDAAHCLGSSVGASTCFILARFYPERFKSYIFATPYFTQFDDGIKAALSQGVTTYLAKLEELLGSRIDNEDIRNTFLANDPAAVLAANSSEWFDYREYIQYIHFIASRAFVPYFQKHGIENSSHH